MPALCLGYLIQNIGFFLFFLFFLLVPRLSSDTYKSLFFFSIPVSFLEGRGGGMGRVSPG